MTPDEIQQKLQAGIDAVKRGQKRFAQELLLQVVEADERSETAWLWLSAAVDSLEDKITALENALHLNPQNQAAQQKLTALRSQWETESPIRAEVDFGDSGDGTHLESLALDSVAATTAGSAPRANSTFDISTYAPISPVEPVSAIDDPYQCLYCGAPATYEMKRCPECGRSLVVKQGSNRLSATMGTATLAMIAATSVFAVETIVLTILRYSGDNSIIQYVYQAATLELFFGDYLKWQPDLTPIVMWVAYGWLVVLVVVMLGFLQRIALAYYAAVGIMVLNMIGTTARWLSGYVGAAMAVPDILISLTALSFVFASQRDFSVNDARLRCVIDPRIKGGEVFHSLGHEHKRKGQWAMAVAHWRAAVGVMPNRAEFYKDLAIGYAQIGYYERALKALDEFSRQSPGHADYAPLKDLIQKKRAADRYPRG